MTKSKLLQYLALLALAVLASALRLETLSERPLWADEANATRVIVARGSISEVIEASRTEYWGNTPPLYYVVSYLHTRVQDSVAALRLPSVEAGVLTALLVAALGTMLFGRAAGIVAGLLLSVCVYHIEYSQDARPYAFLLLLLTATAYCFFAYLTTERLRWLLGFAVSGAASLHSHHLATIYQAAFSGMLGLVLLSRYWRGRGRDGGPSLMSLTGPFVGANFLILWLYLPTIPQLLKFSALSAAGDNPTHTLALSGRFFWELLGRWGNGSEWSAVYAFMLLTGVAYAVRRRDITLALLVWLAVPFVFYANYPFWGVFDIRYLIGALPPFVLLVAAGVVSTGKLAARMFERWQQPGEPLRARLQIAFISAITALLMVLSLTTYAEFRQTKLRCSDFFQYAEIMDSNDGFCRKHLILNSIYEDHAFLLRKQ